MSPRRLRRALRWNPTLRWPAWPDVAPARRRRGGRVAPFSLSATTALENVFHRAERGRDLRTCTLDAGRVQLQTLGQDHRLRAQLLATRPLLAEDGAPIEDLAHP